MEARYSILGRLIVYLKRIIGRFRAWDRRISNRIFPRLFPIFKPYIPPESIIVAQEIKENEIIVPEVFLTQLPILKPYVPPELTVITREIKENEVVVPEVFFAQPPIDTRDHLILYQWRWWWTNEMNIPVDIDRLVP